MPEQTCSTPTRLPALLRRAEAAAHVRNTYGMPCSLPWLAKLAVVGGGPPFHKAGPTPLYPLDELDRWALKRLGALHATTEEHQRAKQEQSGLNGRHGAVGDER